MLQLLQFQPHPRKLSEARIAFLRFIFEDVEQSALQAVFLIFYDEADGGWALLWS